MDFWNCRPVIVTGISGFIGSNLARDLSEVGALVIGIVLDEEHGEVWIADRVVRGSICDPHTFQRAIGLIPSSSKPAAIFHLAAQPLVVMGQMFPRLTLETNILGVINLLESYQKSVGAIVVASTDKVYGRNKELPYTESSPLLGNEQIYEASKLCEDTIARAYWKSQNLPIRVTRCGNVYGPFDTEMSRIIPGTISAFLHKKSPHLRSDGSSYRDYVYVKDITKGYISLAEAILKSKVDKQFAFNFGTDKPSRVLDVVYLIRELLGPDYAKIEPIVDDTSKDEIKRQYLDWSLSHRLLGWQPDIRLKDGLQETINWMKGWLQL